MDPWRHADRVRPAVAGTRRYQAPELSRAPDEHSPQLSGIAGIIELIFGTLLAIGLFSRFSAFILSGLAACAYFIMYAHKSFYPLLNGGKSAVIYAFALLVLAAYGPSRLAIDNLRGGQS